MNIFSKTISVSLTADTGLESRLLADMAKRSHERKILQKILSIKTESGLTRLSQMQDQAHSRAQDILENNPPTLDLVADFYTKEMKATPCNGVSLYHNLALHLVESEHPNLKKAIRRFKEGKIKSTNLPNTFPSAFKQAENLLVGKLRSDIGPSEQVSYLTRKELVKQLRLMSNDLFFAINSGLSEEQVNNFVSLFYELRKVQTTLPVNGQVIKETVVKALKTKKLISLVHIKCLRFTYPQGTGVQVLTDFEDHKVPTKDGSCHYPLSERHFPQRLKELATIFKDCGVNTHLLILLSDQDFIDYFPSGASSVFPENQIEKAEKDAEKYKNILVREFGNKSVSFLRDHFANHNFLADFDFRRDQELQNLKKSTGVYSERFVEERVDYRFLSNQDIFQKDTGRDFARERTYAQLASLQALSILFQSVPDPFILVEEDRGDENQYIGGYRKTALPTLFVKLRDKIT